MGKRKEIRIKVQGTAEAQDLADELKVRDSERSVALKRARSEERRRSERDEPRKGAA